MSACTSATALCCTPRCRACRSRWYRWPPQGRTRTGTRSTGRQARAGRPRRGAVSEPVTVTSVRVSFVSDIHGNIAALREVARQAEQLVVLGDLVDYVDYWEPSAGILGRVFGEQKVRQFIALR